MSNFTISVSEIDRLQNAMKAYAGDVESRINEVLHNEAGTLMENSIQRLIPSSKEKGVKPWKGKPKAASEAKSLRSENENLAVTTITAKTYQYLYFPDDGTNTRRHVGNQQFFRRGLEAVQDEIVDRCVARLTENIFE